MKEKSCRCGASKKNFKMDIGPFYVAECCNAAGFDDLGNPKNQVKAEEAPKQSLGGRLAEGLGFSKKDVEVAAEPEEIQEEPTPGPGEGEAPEESKDQPNMLQRFLGRAGGRGKLMDMKIDDLKLKAKEKGISGADQMTKKQLVAELLK